ncbi:hypothetical protein D3OALGA1CA_5149 [Olavius algarvensis associated proteobacterium Delta 3]|nr:hypothetical protein D3OALGA1CA_5149 [Olavius algarvensis associated proteobacterium Delta 3]
MMGIRVLDSGYWMLDSGYWMLDAGCWIVDELKRLEMKAQS